MARPSQRNPPALNAQGKPTELGTGQGVGRGQLASHDVLKEQLTKYQGLKAFQ